MPVHSFHDLRVWQAARAFKLSVYRLTDAGPLSQHVRLREQLREAAASAASQLAEGYGRFDPLDNARFVRIARASLLECQNHLLDAVDRGFISEQAYSEHHAQAAQVLKEVGAYETYLQSPEAKANAERLKKLRQRRPLARKKERSPGEKHPTGSDS